MKKKSKIGPILGFIGGLMLVFIFFIELSTLLHYLLHDYQLWASYSMYLVSGLLAITGFILTLRNKDIGYYLMFAAGIGCLIALIIAIYTLFLAPLVIAFILTLIGGIYSLITVRKE